VYGGASACSVLLHCLSHESRNKEFGECVLISVGPQATLNGIGCDSPGQQVRGCAHGDRQLNRRNTGGGCRQDNVTRQWSLRDTQSVGEGHGEGEGEGEGDLRSDHCNASLPSTLGINLKHTCTGEQVSLSHGCATVGKESHDGRRESL
jgi:hypothetical protein